MAGYSATPLAQKLGIKPGHRVAVLGAPADFESTLGELPADVVISKRTPTAAKPADVMIFFTTERSDLESRFGELAARLASNGGFWIAWPKKTSGVATDLNENIIREIGLLVGLVNNKVCAIDETWSGLRFVYRIKDRPAAAKSV